MDSFPARKMTVLFGVMKLNGNGAKSDSSSVFDLALGQTHKHVLDLSNSTRAVL